MLPTDEWLTNRNVRPAVEFLDIPCMCVFAVLPKLILYTKKSLKALEGYAYFVAGYVEEVLVTKISDNMLMTAKVMCDSVSVHKITVGHWPFQTNFSQWPIKLDFGWPHFLYISIEVIGYGTNICKKWPTNFENLNCALL